MIYFVEYYPELPHIFLGTRMNRIHNRQYEDWREVPPSIPNAKPSSSSMLVGLSSDDFE